MAEHPELLIENWFPFEEISIECIRERGMVTALPPINFLHVWWARRPLTVSKAAILASILPFETGKKEIQKIIGYSPTIKDEYKRIIEAKKRKIRLKTSYKQERCFKKNYTMSEIQKIQYLIEEIWGKKNLSLLDPMSGGGSIPFEAIKLGLNVFSSDLNPVAAVLLYATLKFPQLFRENLISKIREFKERIIDNSSFLLKCFPISHESEFDAFIWVRTVKCRNPDCNLEVPLSPNWYLSKKPKVIIKVTPPTDFSKVVCKYEIIENPTESLIKSKPGTVIKGDGTCPRCKAPLDREYLKNEAQAGRMGHKLMAIVYKKQIGPRKTIRKYRTPNKLDYEALELVDSIINKKIPEWRKIGIFPEESIYIGEKTREMLNKGIDKWNKLFNNRQLLTNMTILEEIINLKNQLLKDKKYQIDEIRAIITYLQFAFDKMFARNCIQCLWDSGYQRVVHAFGRHDYAFKWNYAEMDIVRKGFDWSVENVLKSYKGLVHLIGDFSNEAEKTLTIKCKPSQHLDYLENNKIDLIVVDPPYYDNVMYAELSDFYYIWMKKGIGDLYPELFSGELTDKDREAVANSSKFSGMGKSKKLLAKQDYEAKMRASFKEMYRVLQPQGVLTVMFTHKKTDAWDTLAMSLMDAGFEITASWPVHTEPEISLNIEKRNAVKTTILLVCRKRLVHNKDAWWEDDVLPTLKEIVHKKAIEFQKLGIDGVDLYISTFGPALREFSRYYPVKNIAGEEVRPEEALKVARSVVTDITLNKIIKGKSQNIDLISKLYLIAWHFYKARRFPFDEARQLALSIGVNIDDLKTYNIISKKSGDIEFLRPSQREKKGILNMDNPKDGGFLINAVHIALLAYQKGGQKLYDDIVHKLRRDVDQSFRQYMEALYNSLPDIKDLEERKLLAELLVSTEDKITPKGGKLTDYV